MNYIIMEIQTENGTTAIVPPVVFEDRNVAEARYHTILAAAAVSDVDVHTVVMLTNDGRTVRYECYRHEYSNNEESK